MSWLIATLYLFLLWALCKIPNMGCVRRLQEPYRAGVCLVISTFAILWFIGALCAVVDWFKMLIEW